VGDNARFLRDSFQAMIRLLRRYEEFFREIRRTGAPPSAEALRRVEDAAHETDVRFLLEEIPQAIRQLLEGIQRVSDIMRAMKEFSHPGGEEKIATDVKKAIENTVTVSRNEWKYVAETVLDIPDNLPPLHCVPGDLNQALLNVIINAAHSIEEKAAQGAGAKGLIRISARADGGWIEIRISDTGAGIPDAIRDRVFEPFFTTKPIGKGTGQGLAIAQSVIADKHGGSIRFESAPGQGATFIIRMPIRPENASPAGPALAAGKGDNG